MQDYVHDIKRAFVATGRKFVRHSKIQIISHYGTEKNISLPSCMCHSLCFGPWEIIPASVFMCDDDSVTQSCSRWTHTHTHTHQLSVSICIVLCVSFCNGCIWETLLHYQGILFYSGPVFSVMMLPTGGALAQSQIPIWSVCCSTNTSDVFSYTFSTYNICTHIWVSLYIDLNSAAAFNWFRICILLLKIGFEPQTNKWPYVILYLYIHHICSYRNNSPKIK